MLWQLLNAKNPKIVSFYFSGSQEYMTKSLKVHDTVFLQQSMTFWQKEHTINMFSLFTEELFVAYIVIYIVYMIAPLPMMESL